MCVCVCVCGVWGMSSCIHECLVIGNVMLIVILYISMYVFVSCVSGQRWHRMTPESSKSDRSNSGRLRTREEIVKLRRKKEKVKFKNLPRAKRRQILKKRQRPNKGSSNQRSFGKTKRK